ncbi:MAG: hypothetical protein HYY59_05875 [Candidatus Omnitrophica bacterium]|nr:hypothetical protein [Candidatus Omnitrophota bacterium]MBI3021508.1 hypothetical protein [Candidatus Omnitrophota bacterium]
MRVLIGCLAAHQLLAHVVPSPWWLPDLTLIGLVLSVGKAPQRWAVLSLTVGCFAMLWMARWAGAIFLGYLLCGWAVGTLARWWDTADARIQGCLVLAAGAAMTLGLLWLDHLWSLPVLGLALARVLVTGGCTPLVRRLVDTKARR